MLFFDQKPPGIYSNVRYLQELPRGEIKEGSHCLDNKENQENIKKTEMGFIHTMTTNNQKNQ